MAPKVQRATTKRNQTLSKLNMLCFKEYQESEKTTESMGDIFK